MYLALSALSALSFKTSLVVLIVLTAQSGVTGVRFDAALHSNTNSPIASVESDFAGAAHIRQTNNTSSATDILNEQSNGSRPVYLSNTPLREAIVSVTSNDIKFAILNNSVHSVVLSADSSLEPLPAMEHVSSIAMPLQRSFVEGAPSNSRESVINSSTYDTGLGKSVDAIPNAASTRKILLRHVSNRSNQRSWVKQNGHISSVAPVDPNEHINHRSTAMVTPEGNVQGVASNYIDLHAVASIPSELPTRWLSHSNSSLETKLSGVSVNHSSFASIGHQGTSAVELSTLSISASNLSMAHTTGTVATLLFIPGVSLLSMILSPYKMIAKALIGCACFAGLMLMLGRCNCCNRCDPRRCHCCARLLLKMGWDSFPAFTATVKVHGIKGFHDTSAVGKKNIFLRVGFRNCVFQTPLIEHVGGNATWELVRTMYVPQGASRCTIELFAEGKFKNTRIGSAVLFTKKDMLKKDSFWGTKQSLKLCDAKGEKATVVLTFWKKEKGRSSTSEGEPERVLFEEVPEDSGLALQLQAELRIWRAVQVNAPGELTPEQKLEVLCNTLSGPLREINNKGKDIGRTYIRVQYCNYAFLHDGQEKAEELRKEKHKAKQKGLPTGTIQKKHYWCWYENRQAPKNQPDGFVPLASFTGVQRSPGRQDQFIVRYSQDGDKSSLTYRRDGGKGLDVWIEGIELLLSHVRKIHQDRREQDERRRKTEQHIREISRQWLAKERVQQPRNTDHWKQWHDHLAEAEFSEEDIKKLFQTMMNKQGKS